MAGKFILLGPGKRKRGGEGANTSLTTVDDAPESTASDTTPLTNNGTTENNNESQQHGIDNISVTYPHENGLLREAKDQYSKDPFYKKILDSPKVFKNLSMSMVSSNSICMIARCSVCPIFVLDIDSFRKL